MEKRFTTSAQKTLTLSRDEILKKLESEMSKNTGLKFEDTKQENIKEAKLKDGSKLIIATFDKGNGKTIAMIDHKNLPVNSVRATIQNDLRARLDKLFKVAK